MLGSWPDPADTYGPATERPRPEPSRYDRARRALVRAGMAIVAVAVGAGAIAGCGDDDGSGLGDHLLTADDLPEGFEASASVDDTITSFCANQDAASGLQADAREIVGFARDPAGLAVVQIAFEFRPGHAERFVRRARDLLEECSEVPDLSGLAFTYEAADDAIDDLLAADTDQHAAGHGVSVGSGNLRVDLAAFRWGDTAQLVAVLGIDESPTPLATDVLGAVLARRPGT